MASPQPAGLNRRDVIVAGTCISGAAVLTALGANDNPSHAGWLLGAGPSPESLPGTAIRESAVRGLAELRESINLLRMNDDGGTCPELRDRYGVELVQHRFR